MASATAHWGKPIWAAKGGAERAATNVAAALAVATVGPGAYSLDHALGIKLPPALVAAAAQAVAKATAQEKMRAKLQTGRGRAVYGLRKRVVEPVFGQIKEARGFRQFSLRGLEAAAGEWCLLCLARNLKRLHVLSRAQGRPLPAPTAPGMVGPAVLGFLLLLLRESALIGVAATAQRRLRRVTRTVQVAGCPLLTPLRTFSPTNC